jgi:phage-related protein (TIGR01555 family)
MTELTTDSLRSLITGLGDPLIDKSASVVYGHHVLSDLQLMNAYRNTWLAKKIVNIPALDALRKWREWQADQGQITLIEGEEKRLGLQQKVLQAKTLARLWGGAVIYIGDGGDAREPWDYEQTKKGGLKYLTVMSRREMIAGELELDPTLETYGWPKTYQVANSVEFLDIHPSRIVVQIGDAHPDPWNTNTNVGWGDSVLQSVWTSITNADSTAANIASLVFEANVDVFKIQDLMEHLSSAVYRGKLIDRFTLANIGKSVSKALIVDSDEEYERKQIAFTGLPDVLQQFLILVSGAADIPLTRLLGQSPSGLNSTGEHDMKNYYDRVASMQTLEIGPALHKLDEALIRSALGDRPAEIFYKWAPLEQMSEKELAEIGKMNAETANILAGTGLFMQEELREVVGNQLVEDGFYPGLGDLLKKNGEQLPEFDLERRATEAGVKALEAGPQPEEPGVTGDAAPRPLYLRRDVKNAADIINWYKDQGVPEVYAPESMHVTIVYSKKPMDWMAMGQPWDATLEIPEGGPRISERFGDMGDVLVLLFASNELQWRHGLAKELGASSDFPEYQPHISISLRASEIDLVNVKPWTGPIVLGPEVYEEIDDAGDWREKVATA